MRILLIEDDDLVREYIEACLGDEGHDVIGVGSADAALARAADRPIPPLIVTDFELGSALDGVDVGDRFRAIDPAIRLLVISGDPVAARRKLATRGPGFGTFLAKPFFKADLLAALGEATGTAGA